MYYNNSNNPPPVSGYNQYPAHSELGVATYDYSEEVVWRADTVVVDGTEFSDQGLTKYNGDHDWACHVDIKHGGKDVLQTYIRGEELQHAVIAVFAYYCVMLLHYTLLSYACQLPTSHPQT